jgi:plastocyanin
LCGTILVMQKGIIIFIVGLLVVGGIWFVTSRNNSNLEEEMVVSEDGVGDVVLDEEMPEEEDAVFETDESDEAEGEVKEFVVTGEDYSFSETEITVNEGDTVRIIFVNGGAMPHDWVLDEFGAATEILQAGEEEVIEFIAGDPGIYEYYCSVGNHRELGMVGTLTVE